MTRLWIFRAMGRGVMALMVGLFVIAGGSTAGRADDHVIRFGVQKYGSLVLLRDRGTLEKALASLGYQVTWTEFPGGPQLLEALNVGAIDFGTTGEAPPIFAQAAGAPLVYVGYEPPAPHGEAILVPAGSSIQSVADLKGKKVALNKGSNVHFLLVQALASAGLTPHDIQPVYLTPADARSAFESGSVDAWAIWDPFYAAVQAASHPRVLVDGAGLVDNHQFFLSTQAFASAHPDLIKLTLTQIGDTDRWAAGALDQAAALIAPPMKLPLPVVKTALARMGFGVRPLDSQVIAEQQKMADTFHALGLIPAAINVREAQWSPPS